ncbi:MAG: DUF4157 domain-containing protein [Armatimonadetes bacterium]|nr:DUF4157 domain-containing protein [Armatimonadota bacterium]
MGLFDDVQDFGGRLYDAGSGVASRTAEFARGVADRGEQGVRDIAGRAYDIGSGAASRAADIAEGIAGRVSDIAGRTGEFARQLYNDPVGTVESAIADAAGAAANARDEAIETVTGIALRMQEQTINNLVSSAQRFGRITHNITQGIATIAEEAASEIVSGAGILFPMISRAELAVLEKVHQGRALADQLQQRLMVRLQTFLHARMARVTVGMLGKVSRLATRATNMIINIGNLMTAGVLTAMNFVVSTIQRFERGLNNIIAGVRARVESVLHTLSAILPDGIMSRVQSFFNTINGYVEILRTRVNRFLDFFVQQATLIGVSVASTIQQVEVILFSSVRELEAILHGLIIRAYILADGTIDRLVSELSMVVQGWLDRVTQKIVNAISVPFNFIRGLIISADVTPILHKIANAARRVDNIVQSGLDMVLNSDIDVGDIVRTLEPIVAGTGRGITAGAGNPSEAQSQHREAPPDPRRGSRHAPGQEDPHTSPLDHARERGIRGGPGTEDLLHRGFNFIGEQIDRVLGVVRPIVQGVGQMVRNVVGTAARTTERILQRTMAPIMNAAQAGIGMLRRAVGVVGGVVNEAVDTGRRIVSRASDIFSVDRLVNTVGQGISSAISLAGRTADRARHMLDRTTTVDLPTQPNDGGLTGPFYPKNRMADPEAVDALHAEGDDRVRDRAIGSGAQVFINGIDTSLADHYRAAQRLANATGNTVVGVYNATGGMGIDLLQCGADKFFDRSANPSVATLVRIIRAYGDARRPHGGMNIFAHSQGSLILSEALRQAQGEGIDLRRIDATTFGNAAFTFPEGPTYHHYIHDDDLVSGTVGTGSHVSRLLNMLPGPIRSLVGLGRTADPAGSTVTLHHGGSFIEPHAVNAPDGHDYIGDLARFRAAERSGRTGTDPNHNTVEVGRAIYRGVTGAAAGAVGSAASAVTGFVRRLTTPPPPTDTSFLGGVRRGILGGLSFMGGLAGAVMEDERRRMMQGGVGSLVNQMMGAGGLATAGAGAVNGAAAAATAPGPTQGNGPTPAGDGLRLRGAADLTHPQFGQQFTQFFRSATSGVPVIDPRMSSHPGSSTPDPAPIPGMPRAGGPMMLQRSGSGPEPMVDAGALHQQLLATGGVGFAPDSGLMGKIGSEVDGDMGGARFHTGPVAEAASRDLGARAFTIGRDVFFGPGEYDPHSAAGLALIGHELTHVGQQTGQSGDSARFHSARGGDEMEREAQQTAMRILSNVGQRDKMRVDHLIRTYEADRMVSTQHKARLDRLTIQALDRAAEIIGIRRADTIRLDHLNVEVSLDLDSLSDGEALEELAQAIATEVMARAGDRTMGSTAKHRAIQLENTAPAPAPHSATGAGATFGRAYSAVRGGPYQDGRQQFLNDLGMFKGVLLQVTSLVDIVLWADYMTAHMNEEAARWGGRIARFFGMRTPSDEELRRRGREADMAAATGMMSNLPGMNGFGSVHRTLMQRPTLTNYLRRYHLVDGDPPMLQVSRAFSEQFDAFATWTAGQLDTNLDEGRMVLSPYELGELEGAIGTQVALAAVGAAEVEWAAGLVRAIGVVGAVGSGRGLLDAIDRIYARNPNPSARDFMTHEIVSAVLNLIAGIVGLSESMATRRLIQIIIAIVFSVELGYQIGELCTLVGRWNRERNPRQREALQRQIIEKAQQAFGSFMNVVMSILQASRATPAARDHGAMSGEATAPASGDRPTPPPPPPDSALPPPPPPGGDGGVAGPPRPPSGPTAAPVVVEPRPNPTGPTVPVDPHAGPGTGTSRPTTGSPQDPAPGVRPAGGDSNATPLPPPESRASGPGGTGSDRPVAPRQGGRDTIPDGHPVAPPESNGPPTVRDGDTAPPTSRDPAPSESEPTQIRPRAAGSYEVIPDRAAAHSRYLEMLTADPGREVGIWRRPDGSYVVVQGEPGHVPVEWMSDPGNAGSELVAHSHPVTDPIHHLPSGRGGDFEHILGFHDQPGADRSRRVVSSIDIVEPNGNVYTTSYGYEPSNATHPYFLEYRDVNGNLNTVRFSDPPWHAGSTFEGFMYGGNGEGRFTRQPVPGGELLLSPAPAPPTNPATPAARAARGGTTTGPTPTPPEGTAPSGRSSTGPVSDDAPTGQFRAVDPEPTTTRTVRDHPAVVDDDAPTGQFRAVDPEPTTTRTVRDLPAVVDDDAPTGQFRAVDPEPTTTRTARDLPAVDDDAPTGQFRAVDPEPTTTRTAIDHPAVDDDAPTGQFRAVDPHGERTQTDMPAVRDDTHADHAPVDDEPTTRFRRNPDGTIEEIGWDNEPTQVDRAPVPPTERSPQVPRAPGASTDPFALPAGVEKPPRPDRTASPPGVVTREASSDQFVVRETQPGAQEAEYFFNAQLEPDGTMSADVIMEHAEQGTRSGQLRMGEILDDALAHFGPSVKAFATDWGLGSNIDAFNHYMNSGQCDFYQAAANTPSGILLRRRGFVPQDIVVTPNPPGPYTSVQIRWVKTT